MGTSVTRNDPDGPSVGIGEHEYLHVRIVGNADAASRARSELSRLKADLDPPLLESIRLLITELITNAVRHALAPAVEMTVTVSERDVHVEVANPGGDFEAAPSGPEDSDSGWGLFLVDRLSERWGVAQDSGSVYQRVWFELARA